jgi:hypothetical protein
VVFSIGNIVIQSKSREICRNVSRAVEVKYRGGGCVSR